MNRDPDPATFVEVLIYQSIEKRDWTVKLVELRNGTTISTVIFDSAEEAFAEMENSTHKIQRWRFGRPINELN